MHIVYKPGHAITAPSSYYGGILTLTYSCRTIATNPSSTVSNANSSGPNASSSGPNTSSTGPRPNTSSTGPNASSTGPNASSSSTGPNVSNTEPNTSSTGPNASRNVPNASSTGLDADSTTAASLSNESTQAQFSTDSDDPFPAAIVVSVVVPVIIVVLVVAVFMYRRGQCMLLPGKCRKRYAKHSPDRADTHARSSTVNENVYCDLNRDVDVNGRDVDYCDLDKVEQN